MASETLPPPPLPFRDPNIRWSNKTIRLRFLVEDYERIEEVTIGGNVSGVSYNISSAVSNLAERLDRDDYGDLRISLTRPSDSRSIVCVCGDGRFEVDDEKEWLLEMLVAAEFVKIEQSEAWW